MIPIHTSARGALFASIVVLVLASIIIVNSSKPKNEYQESTGTIEYLDDEYGELPIRNKGDYRYLKISSYPLFFEIFEPNREETTSTIDDLKVGDVITIYYYENSSTGEAGLNRFAQFIDHQSRPYFIRNSFQKSLGYFLIGLAIIVSLLALYFWKKGKLGW